MGILLFINILLIIKNSNKRINRDIKAKSWEIIK